MDVDLDEVLSHWPAAAGERRVVPLARSSQSYSDARLWRVEVEGRRYALRNWDRHDGDWRQREVHNIQCHFASQMRGLVPALERKADGDTLLVTGNDRRGRGGQYWELSRWLPGESIERREATPLQFRSAMRTLAELHLGGARPIAEGLRAICPWIWNNRDQYAKRHRHPLRALSTAMNTRAREVASMVHATLCYDRGWRRAPAHETPTIVEAMELVNLAAIRYAPILAPWPDIEMPLDVRHGDAHLGNFLFTENEVTGVIDYGAADLDSQAADVGRLLGSLAGDDPQNRGTALDIYQSVRPLSELEVAAVDLFDRGGVIVAAHRWICRLEPSVDPELDQFRQIDRAASLKRLRQLVERMRAFAA
jgi:Ser/Thr protein kinase RdoA (MazF antagonist)